jgi:hypothetical protein
MLGKTESYIKELDGLGKGGLPEYMSAELPSGVEEVGYELYPKNGEQMWESYHKYSKQVGFDYDDDLVLDSIKRTEYIAHDLIEDFMPDNEVRLPSFVVPAGKTDIQALTQDCLKGLKEKEINEKQEYVDQA